ncbi:MAG: 3,4-dihydroxy-2-butanone-4-phosphate synthase [Methyloligellaceae bacterium]
MVTEPDKHENSFLSPISEVIEDARQGKMFILVDAEDRENEGDLVIPAQMATPEAVNFMAKYGRGLICLTLTQERSEKLNLALMSQDNQSRNQTAFTVSVEAREGITTGISAHDRAHTIAVAIDERKTSQDIVSPGHVFPLVARTGGVLVRAGHTEAAVDIARLAGHTPAGVICEIMNDDGTMARMPDLIPFAKEHGLKIGTIEDLIAYRRKYDNLVQRTSEYDIESIYGGDFSVKVYTNTAQPSEHLALVKGDVSTGEPVLVRVHSSDVLSDMLGIGTKGYKHSLLEKSMKKIAEEGRGVIVLIRDVKPGAVSGKLNKLCKTAGKSGKKDGKSNENRLVEYGIGAQILQDLGVKEMVLLSNSPMPRVVGLDAYGLQIKGLEKIV